MGFSASESGILYESARRWAKKRIQEGCQRFVAAGGDGTVTLAANALQGLKSACLGSVALGSSNDFHKPYQSPGRKSIEGIPCRLEFEAAFLHDLGEVEFWLPSGQVGKVFFIINSSLGLSAQANANFNQGGVFFNWIKKTSVNSAIFFTALKQLLTFTKIPIQIQWDQMPLQQAELINLGIIKNHYFAGDLRYDLPQPPDNGLFGFHFFGTGLHAFKSPVSRLQLIRTFLSLMKGKFNNLPHTLSHPCSEVTFQSAYPISLETDGEVRQVIQAKFTIRSKEIWVCP